MALPDIALFTNSRPFFKPSMPIPPAHRRNVEADNIITTLQAE